MLMGKRYMYIYTHAHIHTHTHTHTYARARVGSCVSGSDGNKQRWAESNETRGPVLSLRLKRKRSTDEQTGRRLAPLLPHHILSFSGDDGSRWRRAPPLITAAAGTGLLRRTLLSLL